jgi:Fur family ferric uptake transcriptional regulator
MVLQAIAESPSHASVEDIHKRASRSYRYLDIATVYRTVQLLKRLGIVTEVGLGSRLHYELAAGSARHHHMVCERCGGAYDLPPVYLDELRSRLAREFKFQPSLDHFTISGVCGGCASATG